MKLPGIGVLWQRLERLILHYEKVLLALLSVVIVLSGTFWYRQFAASQTDQPTPGGTYVEGIVGDRSTLEAVAARITKAGLFGIDQNGKLQNQLISNWQVNDTKDEYRFTLVDGVDMTVITNTINDNAEALDQAAATDEAGTLIVRLPSANPNLPILLTQPLFDYGPYKLSKINSETAVLIRNAAPQAVTTYLNKIVLHTFPSEAELQTALTRHKIDGAYTKDQNFSAAGYDRKDWSEPLYYALILNVNRAPFRDNGYRQQILNNQPSAKTAFTLTFPAEEPYQTLASKLIQDWQSGGVTVTADPHPIEEIEQKIAPSRDFQAIITGVSYGNELDPYYLWDSSQIRPPGNNLSGVKSDKIDQLISQIRSTNDPVNRKSLIDGLGVLLKQEGAAEILGQEKASFLISSHFRFVPPVIALSPLDHWRSINLWSAK